MCVTYHKSSEGCRGRRTCSLRCIKAPLGVHERIARSLLIKQFTPKKLRDWDIDPVAVSQAFGHSKEVEEGSYKYGLKNTVNALQAHVLETCDFSSCMKKKTLGW